MRKKLFLIGLAVFSVLFSSFSSASSISTSCNGYKKPCSSYDYTYNLYGNTYSCFNVPSNTESVVLSPSGCSFFNYSFGGDTNWNEECNKTYTFTDKSVVCVNNDRGSYSITFNPAPTLPGGASSSLTPAINGLHDTVLQIIPFVIYIGIGVLLAILGFYAIRRLVNRIAKKINSIFKSKRS